MQNDPLNPDRNGNNKDYTQRKYNQFLENQQVRAAFCKASEPTPIPPMSPAC
jgi:hypothetical protein